MKKTLFLIMTLVCFSWGQAFANYSFEFTSSDGTYGVTGTLVTPANGNGPFIVSDGFVTGTGTVNNGITYTLVPAVPGGSTRSFGGTDLIFDNLLSPNQGTFLTSNGLVFESKDASSYINIWGNSPGSYTLFHLANGEYGPQVNGTASVAAVPIPGSALLLGSGVIGLLGFGRRKAQA